MTDLALLKLSPAPYRSKRTQTREVLRTWGLLAEAIAELGPEVSNRTLYDSLWRNASFTNCGNHLVGSSLLHGHVGKSLPLTFRKLVCISPGEEELFRKP